MIGLKWYEIHKEWLIKGLMIPKRLLQLAIHVVQNR